MGSGLSGKFIANLLCRGAAHLRYKGHRGAMVRMGMTVLVHNAVTLVRMQQNRLSKRAQKLRRLLGLKEGVRGLRLSP